MTEPTTLVMGGVYTECPECGRGYRRGGQIGLHHFIGGEEHECSRPEPDEAMGRDRGPGFALTRHTEYHHVPGTHAHPHIVRQLMESREEYRRTFMHMALGRGWTPDDLHWRGDELWANERILGRVWLKNDPEACTVGVFAEWYDTLNWPVEEEGP